MTGRTFGAPAGMDAYQVACAETGFAGTRSEWLASLRGDAGPAVPRIAKTDLTTVSGTFGSYTLALGGPNFFVGKPSLNITPHASDIRFDYSVTGSVGAGFTAAITFVSLRATVTILVLGVVNLTTPPTSAVVFDLQAFDPT